MEADAGPSGLDTAITGIEGAAEDCRQISIILNGFKADSSSGPLLDKLYAHTTAHTSDA